MAESYIVGTGGILCGQSVKVGRLTLYCDLLPTRGAHANGITEQPVHVVEYRNATIRILVQWEGRP